MDNIKRWEHSKREDLKAIPLMTQNLFEVQFSYEDERYKRITPDNPPVRTVNFKRNDLHVWMIGPKNTDGTTMRWQTALLTNTHYINHKSYDTLEEIIEDINTLDLKTQL